MYSYERAYFASVIASGLVSAHGVDHGGVEPEVIADRAVAIADSIAAKCRCLGKVEPESDDEVPETDPAIPEPANPVAPAPPSDSGDAGQLTQPEADAAESD